MDFERQKWRRNRALAGQSRWFTLSHGILDEIYYPRVDQACTRDFGFIVTDGEDFFAEEKRDCTFEIFGLEDGVPAFRLVNTHVGGRFRIHKDILSDQRADVVIQRVRLEVLDGPPLRLFALLAPHLVNGGAHNTAWIGDYKGHRLLFAEGAGTRLALGCSRALVAHSVGFVGTSDGWQMLHRTGYLTEEYDKAADGNVALTAEIEAPEEEFRLALGFGRSAPEAAFRVRASLQTPLDRQMEEYATGWRAWQAQLRSLDRKVGGHNVYRVSTAVLRCHESPTFPGGLIASLSIPWGSSKGDDDLGGYHLVWPRDLARRPALSSPAVRSTRCCASCATCVPFKKTTGVGRRIAGWTARHTGTVSNSTNARSPCCCWIWRGVRVRFSGRCCRPIGQWCREPQASSSATDRAPGRTVGKKMRDTRRSPWPFRLPPCLPRRSWRRPAISTMSPHTAQHSRCLERAD